MNNDWIGIADLYLQSLQISWDAHPAPQAKLTDLSPAKIDRFIQRVNNNGRFALEGSPALAAEAFYLINAIEKYGTGFIRIRRALQEYPEIDFEESESRFLKNICEYPPKRSNAGSPGLKANERSNSGAPPKQGVTMQLRKQILKH